MAKKMLGWHPKPASLSLIRHEPMASEKERILRALKTVYLESCHADMFPIGKNYVHVENNDANDASFDLALERMLFLLKKIDCRVLSPLAVRAILKLSE